MNDETPKPAQPDPTSGDGDLEGAPAGSTPENHPEGFPEPTTAGHPEPVDGERADAVDPSHEHRLEDGTPHDAGTGPEGEETAPTAEGSSRPERKKRKLLVPVIAAVLVLALLIGGGITAVLLLGNDSHQIVTPATAGGMKRDTKTETTLKTQLSDAEKQFKAQDKLITTTKSAIYTQSDTKRGPEGGLVFLGGKISKPDEKAATAFLQTVRKQATSNGFKVSDVDAGDGAKALCAYQAQASTKIAICAWATKDTRGEVLPTVSGWETPTLAKVMRSLREDVEVSG